LKTLFSSIMEVMPCSTFSAMFYSNTPYLL
jgi:hypothetical protein